MCVPYCFSLDRIDPLDRVFVLLTVGLILLVCGAVSPGWMGSPWVLSVSCLGDPM